MLVNGDDIAFSCTPERYQKWSADLADFGFVKSVGKNYAHRRFLIINSEVFDSKFEETGQCHIPYYPVGLLLGRSKVAKDDSKLGAPPVIVSLELVLRGAHNKQHAMNRFMAYNHEAVEKVTNKKLNLFLPITRGGLGLKRYGLEYHIGVWQRRYARYLSRQVVLKTDHFVREAVEAGQWKPVYRLRDIENDPLYVSRSYRKQGALWIEDILSEPYDHTRITTEPTWLPGLSDSSRETILRNFYKRSKDYLSELRTEGPPGWKLQDSEGRTTWKTRLSKRTMKQISSEEPLLGDLQNELPYRYSSYIPNDVPTHTAKYSEIPINLLTAEQAEYIDDTWKEHGIYRDGQSVVIPNKIIDLINMF